MTRKPYSRLPYGVLYVAEEPKKQPSVQNAYVFLCNNQTEQECLERQLFGAPTSEWGTLSQIKEGDIIFLFNFQSNHLHGVFEAEGNAQPNIDPYAFYGRFPVQVRVRTKIHCQWADKGAMLPLIKRRWIKTSWKGVLLFPRKLDAKLVDELYRILLRIPRLPTSKAKPTEYKAKDGHYTQSYAEKLIDDWLHLRIPYKHEYDFILTKNGKRMTCDWYISEVPLSIEYWETSEREQTNTMYVKHRFYKANSIKAIDIYADDLPSLDRIIPTRIKTVEPNFRFRKLSR